MRRLLIMKRYTLDIADKVDELINLFNTCVQNHYATDSCRRKKTELLYAMTEFFLH